MGERKRPYVIGLTGGIASGKTMAAQHLESLGARVLDADAISRSLTADGGEALPAIRERFGDDVFSEGGALERRRLGDIVFADVAQKRALEAILHPMVQRRIMEQLDVAARDGCKIVVLNVPLLFETGMDALCDQTWTLTVDVEEQLKRVIERDGLTREQAAARVANQMSTSERDARADVVIRTARPIEHTRAELSQLYAAALKRL